MLFVQVQDALHFLERSRGHLSVRIQQKQIGIPVPKFAVTPVAGTYESAVLSPRDVAQRRKMFLNLAAGRFNRIVWSSIIKHENLASRGTVGGQAFKTDP